MTNRLTSSPLGSYTYGDGAHRDGATAIGSTWSASYDAAGNMQCRSATSATACGSSPTGNVLAYDNEGNLAAWLSSANSPTAMASYLYDGEGNRVEQVTTVPATTTTTLSIGGLEEVATSSAVTTTTAYYDGLATSVNGTLSYTLGDGLGSVSAAVSTSGTVTATQLYGPYGSVRYSSGSMPGTKGYTGQHADAVTGLDYYGARYYDAVAGQFTSADTTLAGGLNRYAYVAGNPETRTDPTGHVYTCGMECGGGGGGNNGGGDGNGNGGSSNGGNDNGGCGMWCGWGDGSIGCGAACVQWNPPVFTSTSDHSAGSSGFNSCGGVTQADCTTINWNVAFDTGLGVIGVSMPGCSGIVGCGDFSDGSADKPCQGMGCDNVLTGPSGDSSFFSAANDGSTGQSSGEPAYNDVHRYGGDAASYIDRIWGDGTSQSDEEVTLYRAMDHKEFLKLRDEGKFSFGGSRAKFFAASASGAQAFMDNEMNTMKGLMRPFHIVSGVVSVDDLLHPGVAIGAHQIFRSGGRYMWEIMFDADRGIINLNFIRNIRLK